MCRPFLGDGLFGLPLSRFSGMSYVGGVFEIGEFFKFIRKFLSYTIFVPETYFINICEFVYKNRVIEQTLYNNLH